MKLAQIISVDSILLTDKVHSKKRALETASKLLAQSSALDADSIFSQLIERERLGSTGIGHQIALPHARLSSATQLQACCILLAKPIDFDSLDDQPIDVLIALIIPDNENNEHLQTLSKIARMFSNDDIGEALRNAKYAEDIHKLFIDNDKDA